MKNRIRISLLLSLILFAFWLSSTSSMGASSSPPAKGNGLRAEAKVTQAEARQTALKRVSKGTIKEGELEREGGRLIWSFDIATSGTQNITEVQVDAKNGKVVSVTTESPEKEAREAAEEKAGEKAGEKGKSVGKPSLAAQAKLSRAQAEKIALTRAPSGKVREGELEKEKGRLIWSFDIATPGTKNITEVQVDAKTGKVVSVATETPQAQQREAAEEKQESGGKGAAK